MNTTNYFEEYQTDKDIVIPEVTFDSYVPDDFIYAPEPDMWFRYSVKDPITGEPIRDPENGLYATDFIGYSVEYGDECYWTYNVYRESLYGDEAKAGDEWMDGIYSPGESKAVLPQSFLGYWNFEIESLERDVENGDIEMTMSIQTLYTTIEITDYGTGNHDYVVEELPPIDLYINEAILIYVNGELLSSEFYFKEYLFYEIVSFNPFEMRFVEERKDKLFFSIDLDYETFGEQDLEVLFLTEPTRKQVDSNSSGVDYLMPDSAIQQERKFVPISDNNNYEVSFGTGLQNEILIPYLWNGEYEKWEVITFEKLFTNKYKYPTTTKDLLKISYTDGYTNDFPESELESEALISIDGKDDIVIPISKRYEDDGVIIYTNQVMYYDYIEKTIKLGTSNGEFEDEQGIVMPWDEVVNGTIEFDFKIKTYKEYNFNITLKISDENKLRGKDGKYEIVEVS